MSFEQIIGPILQLLDTVFIYINSLVYDFISFLYQIFVAIAGAQIFTSEQYQTIASRVYVIIGVVSLFFIAYALLNAIVDPDGNSKSEYSVKKIIPNIIIVIMLIGFVPVLFSMAYKIQEIVVSTNIIPKIILGKDNGSTASNEETGELSYKKIGRSMANEIWTGFIYPKDNVEAQDIEINECYFPAPNCDGIEDTSTLGNVAKVTSLVSPATAATLYLSELIGDKIDKLSDNDRSYTLADAYVEVDEGTKNFQVYANFGKKMHGEDKEIEYNPLFQLIAGIVVIYVLINFCIDIGVRAVKLGYYQIIAPVPILLRLMPGQNKVFNNWLKSTVSTYIDIFFRIAIFSLGILAISLLPALDDTLWANSAFADNTVVQNFARVFLIIGILIFIKQAPKLLSDLFGLQGGGFKLGIKDKLGEMVGIGGAVKKGLESAEGATTGALGGAYSALMNRGNIKKGAQAGFWTGMKDGGKQFKRQMQNIYSLGGGKGQVGAFGGQKWSDRMSDRYKDRYKDDYRGVLSAKVNSATDVTVPNSAISSYYQGQLNDSKMAGQKLVVETEKEKNAAENKLNDIRTNFETDKQQKLSNLNNVITSTNAVNAKKLVSDFSDFNEEKKVKLDKMKTDINALQSNHEQVLNSARMNWDTKRNSQIQQIKNDMSIQEQAFNTNKMQQLSNLNTQLSQQQQLGNVEMTQRLQTQINELNASQFDASPYQSKIKILQADKFENTDEYKTIKVKQNAEMSIKQKEYEDYKKISFENDERYLKGIAVANVQEKDLYNKFVDVYNSKVEDSSDYQEASKDYEEKMSDYSASYSALNEATEVIYKYIFDPKKKSLVKRVYNPHAKNEEDKYIDPNDREAIEKAKVTLVEKNAYEAAVKELKDRNETFKNMDTKLASEISNKEDAEWLKSEEGRHMDILLNKLKAQSSSDSKENKK